MNNLNVVKTEKPDWVDVLREQCKKASQKKTADKIGYSPAVVNQVLKGTYKGDVVAVEQAVRGALMNTTVDCPVMGAMLGDECLRHQRQPFAATNPMRLKLYKACRNGCPNKRG